MSTSTTSTHLACLCGESPTHLVTITNVDNGNHVSWKACEPCARPDLTVTPGCPEVHRLVSKLA